MRTRFLSLLLTALCLVPLATRANDIEPGKEFYTVIYAPNPVVLDGDLSEWSGVPVLADPRFAVPKYSGTNPAPNYVLFEVYDAGGPGTAVWTGPDDHTSAVQIVYDADNVYFGFVVTDEYHENSANSAWNGDSVQLMIADQYRTNQVALYNYALGGVEGALGTVIVEHEAGPGGTEAVVTRNSTTKKTTYEIKLPKTSLGLTTLKGGPKFGLGMAINDGDQDAPGQQGWGGLGAHSIVFGKTPSETALVTLAKGNDIEPTKEYYTALRTTNTITLDGNLSEWTGAPVLADPRFAVPKYSGTNDTPNYVLFEVYDAGGPGTAVWTGPDDHTSAVQIVYDADNVYFGFVVTDEYHENSANSAWNGDSVQLMIASADRTTQVALYNYALGGVEGALGNVIVEHEAGPGGTEATVVRDGVNKKTRYEIKLPASALGLTPPLTVGTQFGLGMAINDGDQDAPGQQGWGGLGAHSIVFGKTPSETAQVTLGTTVSGSDRLFLSAINSVVDTFSFRANDKGASIVDPASARLRIDGQLVTLTPSPKVGDATDFTYKPVPPFSTGTHTYSIEVRDTLGNIVTDSGSFLVPVYTTLTTAHQAVSVDTNQPGFIWRAFENGFFIYTTNLANTELAIAGQLLDDFGSPLDNLANPAVVGIAAGAGTVDGPMVRFEIPTVINLSQTGGDMNGNFIPDDQMPGIPGTFDSTDGAAGEIRTFAQLPAGLITMGVTSDDGFRVQGGFVNSPTTGLLLGESELASTTTNGTTFTFLVQFPGVYPLRTIWFENIDLAHIEWFTVKADGSRVLLNDTANGGFRTYRVGVAPGGFPLSIKVIGGQITITWTEPGTVLQESTNLTSWTDLTTATSPYVSTPGGRTAVFYRLKKP